MTGQGSDKKGIGLQGEARQRFGNASIRTRKASQRKNSERQ